MSKAGNSKVRSQIEAKLTGVKGLDHNGSGRSDVSVWSLYHNLAVLPSSRNISIHAFSNVNGAQYTFFGAQVEMNLPVGNFTDFPLS